MKPIMATKASISVLAEESLKFIHNLMCGNLVTTFTSSK